MTNPIPENEITNGAWRGVDGRFIQLPEQVGRRWEARRNPPDRLELHSRIVPGLMRAATSGDPQRALRAVRYLRYRIELLEMEAVTLARNLGWAWRDIGDELGMRRQTVHRRYAARLKTDRIGVPPPRRRTKRPEP